MSMKMNGFRTVLQIARQIITISQMAITKKIVMLPVFEIFTDFRSWISDNE